MTNTTDQYWEVDGVSLNTFAHNIESLSGRDTPPAFRGDDTLVPYQEGEIWEPKLPGSRVIPLGMWVRGMNDDNSTPADKANKFDENWDTLKQLFYTPGRQFALRKRFWASGSIRTAVAMGEYNGGLERQMFGRHMAKFVVNIKLADPWFYEETPVSTALVNGNQNIVIPGNVNTSKIMLTMEGARDQPKVRNNTLGVDVEYNAALSTGDQVEIDVKAFTSITTPDGEAPFRSSGTIVHSGAVPWLVAQPGTNQINLSNGAGAGTAPVTLDVYGAWI